MSQTTIALLVTIGFSVVGVVGDAFLKLASEKESSLKTPWFYIGFAVYASTAFGWVYVMKHLKLGQIAVVYSVSMMLLLTAVGVLIYREALNFYEVIGLAMAVGSLILLVRFAA
jgi:drug/metabolite transporter (DMT)-like permease